MFRAFLKFDFQLHKISTFDLISSWIDILTLLLEILCQPEFEFIELFQQSTYFS